MKSSPSRVKKHRCLLVIKTLFCDDVPRKSSATALKTSQDQHVDRPQTMRAMRAPERKGSLNVDVCGIHWNTTIRTCIMLLKQCHKPPIWEWFIAPIYVGLEDGLLLV